MAHTFPTEGKIFEGLIVNHKVENGQISYQVRTATDGPEVKNEDLNWIMAETSPSMAGGIMSGGAMDMGTRVSLRKLGGQGGSSQFSIIGAFQNVENGGGKGTEVAKQAKTASGKPRVEPVKQQPDVRTTQKNGVEVVEVVEKGDWKPELMKGMVNNLSVTPIFGSRPPQVNSISTAIDMFEGILTSDMLSSLPGSSFSIGGLLDSMPSALKDQLSKAMPKGAFEQLESIMAQIPNQQISSSGGSNIGSTRINPEVFFVNAVKLLKDVEKPADMIGVIQKLATDTTLHGMESLPNVISKVATAFGELSIEISPDGSVSTTKSELMQQAEAAMGQLLSGVNVLQSVSDKLLPMLERIPTADRQAFKTNFENLQAKAKVHGTTQLKQFFS